MREVIIPVGIDHDGDEYAAVKIRFKEIDTDVMLVLFRDSTDGPLRLSMDCFDGNNIQIGSASIIVPKDNR